MAFDIRQFRLDARSRFVSPGLNIRDLFSAGRFAALACTALLGFGCASTYRPYMNEPLGPETRAAAGGPAHVSTDDLSATDSGLMLIVSFSGGGTRAAALAYGILDKLKKTKIRWDGRDTTLLEEITLVSGVSGGSITAAYFSASDDGAFEDLKPKFLNHDFESDLIAAAIDPANAFHLTSPWYGRGNLLADQFDRLLFHGLNYGQIMSRRARPLLVITATDLSLGTTFEFTEQQFHRICSDINTFPLATAVAASNSVPILFTPITLRNYADACPSEPSAAAGSVGAYSDRRERHYAEAQSAYRNVQERRYIHLVDGGLVDNLGIKRIIDNVVSSGGITRSLQSRGARGIRKLVFLTVDAGRHNSFAGDRVDSIPSTMEVTKGIQFGLLSRHAIETKDAFADEVEKWRREIRIAASQGDGPFAPNADLYYIEIGLADHPNEATRAELLAIPTAYTLDPGQVEALINAGHELLDANAEFRRLLKDLASPTRSDENKASLPSAD